MTLTEFRYVVALDRERHFGRAAERCFVSQPTLSVALKKLEEQLGVTLFERQRGKVAPTEVGARIVAQARRVLEEAELIPELARAGQDALSGRLRLGAIYSVGPYLLPRVLPTLTARAPRMPLFIEENYTATLSRMLRHNEMDVIVISEPFSPQGVRRWALYDEPFVVVLPASHPWADEDSIPAQWLENEELLLLGPGHCFRDQVIAACPGCDQSGEEEQPLAGSSVETVRHMVASGLGITVLPQTAVLNRDESNALLAIRPFRGTPPTRRIALAWRRSYPRMEAVNTLREAILDCGLPGIAPLPDASPGE